MVQPAPVQARTPVEPEGTRTRAYTPSKRLERAASVNTARGFEGDHARVRLENPRSSSTPVWPGSPERLYTPDQLAARTPRGTHQALSGQVILTTGQCHPQGLRHMLRSKQCFVDFSDARPDGPAQFKIKYRANEPIALELVYLETKAYVEGSHGGDREVTVSEKGNTSMRRRPRSSTPQSRRCSYRRLSRGAVAKGLLLFARSSVLQRQRDGHAHPASAPWLSPARRGAPAAGCSTSVCHYG